LSIFGGNGLMGSEELIHSHWLRELIDSSDDEDSLE
jgi:hypothetical protein